MKIFDRQNKFISRKGLLDGWMNVVCLALVAVIGVLFVTVFINPRPGVESGLIFIAGAALNIIMTIKSYRERQMRYVIYLAIAIALVVAFFRMV